MLRLLVLLLLAANLAFFAWTQGWIGTDPAPVAAGPRPEIQPERVLVLPRHPEAMATEADALPGATGQLGASTPPSGRATAPAGQQAAFCIEAGPFNDDEFATVERAVRQVQPGLAWTTLTRTSPAQWVVYMGPFGNEDLLERKQDELRRMADVRFEVLRSPPNLAPGISLGRFEQEGAAQAALARFRDRGVRTARVVQLRTAIERRLMRVAEADAAIQVALSGLALPRGQSFTACRF